MVRNTYLNQLINFNENKYLNLAHFFFFYRITNFFLLFFIFFSFQNKFWVNMAISKYSKVEYEIENEESR